MLARRHLELARDAGFKPSFTQDPPDVYLSRMERMDEKEQRERTRIARLKAGHGGVAFAIADPRADPTLPAPAPAPALPGARRRGGPRPGGAPPPTDAAAPAPAPAPACSGAVRPGSCACTGPSADRRGDFRGRGRNTAGPRRDG